jgi:hypothetical protein
MPDLWPDDFGSSDVTPPIATLREQAEHITRRTGGVVVGEVKTGTDQAFFVHYLALIAPVLDNYRYYLLMVKHSLDLYPLELHVYSTGATFNDVKSEAEFLGKLREALVSGQTKKVLNSLLVQSRAAQQEARPASA